MRHWMGILASLCLLSAACAPAAGPAANPPAASSGAPAASAPAGSGAPAASAPAAGSGASSGASSGTTSVASGPELVIGATAALTGPFSEPGKWYQRVWDWYFKELNAKGGLLGRPVKLVIYDDESDPNKAATLYEQLLTVDQGDLRLGPSRAP